MHVQEKSYLLSGFQGLFSPEQVCHSLIGSCRLHGHAVFEKISSQLQKMSLPEGSG